MKVKKFVYLAIEQDRLVRRLAREAMVSQSEVIRRAIDAFALRQATEVADKRRVMKYLSSRPDGWADDPSEFFRG